MAWYLIMAIAVVYLLIGCIIVVLFEEILDKELDEFVTVLVVFWPALIASALLVLLINGLTLLLRSAIMKILKR